MRENEVILVDYSSRIHVNSSRKKFEFFKKNLGVLRIKFSKNGSNRSDHARIVARTVGAQGWMILGLPRG
jgi:hypothetical protein